MRCKHFWMAGIAVASLATVVAAHTQRPSLYAAQTTLDAKAKNIRVVIQNAGHRPVQ